MFRANYTSDCAEWRAKPDLLGHAVGELTRERIGNQIRAAAKIGYSPQFLSLLLSGKKTMSYRQLNRILDACQATSEERTSLNAWGAREAGWRF